MQFGSEHGVQVELSKAAPDAHNRQVVVFVLFELTAQARQLMGHWIQTVPLSTYPL
jgi:hypothetical protein